MPVLVASHWLVPAAVAIFGECTSLLISLKMMGTLGFVILVNISTVVRYSASYKLLANSAETTTAKERIWLWSFVQSIV